MNSLDFSGLTTDEARAVQSAISRGENFHGHIPVASLTFIVRNYRELGALGALEAPWLDAYVHASHFNAHGVSVLKAVFDACDRKRLRSLKPLGDDAIGRLTLFRGCAGPVHSWGMSWTSSLDKAIWYAAHHAEFYNLSDPPSFQWTPMLAFRSWRGVSDECSTPGVSGIVQAGGR